MNLSVLLSGNGQAQGGGQSMVFLIVVYGLIIGAFWFFAIRPQKKNRKSRTL